MPGGRGDRFASTITLPCVSSPHTFFVDDGFPPLIAALSCAQEFPAPAGAPRSLDQNRYRSDNCAVRGMRALLARPKSGEVITPT